MSHSAMHSHSLVKLVVLEYSTFYRVSALVVDERHRRGGLGAKKIKALQRLATWRGMKIRGIALGSSRGFWLQMGFAVSPSNNNFAWSP